MPWVVDNSNGGFSEAKPWLPLAVEHLDRAVSRQADDNDSTLSFYKQMIRYRQERKALGKGSLEVIQADENRLTFVRQSGQDAVFCAFNLSDAEQDIRIPHGEWHRDVSAPFAMADIAERLTLEPWGAYFAHSKRDA